MLPVALIIAALLILASVLLAPAMAQPGALGVQDAKLLISVALPAAASSTTTPAAGIDTGITTNDAFQTGDVDFLLSAPAVTTAMLPNTDTITYNVILSASANLSSPTTLYAAAITQTGAGGVGAAAATYRFRLPSVLPAGMRYVGFNANTGAGTGNCSTVTASLAALV